MPIFISLNPWSCLLCPARKMAVCPSRGENVTEIQKFSYDVRPQEFTATDIAPPLPAYIVYATGKSDERKRALPLPQQLTTP